MSGHNGAQGANISEQERVTSLAIGGGLAVLGARMLSARRPAEAIGLLVAGGALLFRGATKHCPMYEAVGKDNSEEHSGAAPTDVKPKSDVVELTQVMTINRPAQELYEFWRDSENLAQFMPMIESVREVGERRLQWSAMAPGNQHLEWESEIIEDVPGRRLRWETKDTSDTSALAAQALPHHAEVTFEELAHDRGTAVRFTIGYDMRSTLGLALSKLIGAAPDQYAREALRRFKQITEAGELAQAYNQPVA